MSVNCLLFLLDNAYISIVQKCAYKMKMTYNYYKIERPDWESNPRTHSLEVSMLTTK